VTETVKIVENERTALTAAEASYGDMMRVA
jgi:hypothetical protein